MRKVLFSAAADEGILVSVVDRFSSTFEKVVYKGFFPSYNDAVMFLREYNLTTNKHFTFIK
jgi:hypothetical protein